MSDDAPGGEKTRRAVVVGGGVAGIAAAIALAQADRKVTLIEKRPRLGGRALSFRDETTGDEVDNGQHILLGCCTNTIDFLKSIGQGRALHWTDTFHYRLPDGARHDFRLRAWPAPFHALPALLGFGALRVRERLAIIRAFCSLPWRSKNQRRRESEQTMSEWLAHYRQPKAAIERFWNPILVGAVNEELDVAAVAPCLKVFLDGFIPHPQAARFGIPDEGLGVVIGDAAREKLASLGVEVLSRTRATKISAVAKRATAIELEDGKKIETDSLILALPAPALARLQSNSNLEFVDPKRCEDLEFSPIAGVHLWYDRKVSGLEHGALLDSPMHWYFTRPTRYEAAGQRLSFVISASRHLEGMTPDAVVELADRELKRYIPEARGARLLHQVVVREKRATFSATPDFEAMRPSTRTPFANVALAGDWIGTDWPSTLEGSIRSGRGAADFIIGDGRSRITPDLPIGMFARFLRR